MESSILWTTLAALSSAILFIFEKQAATKVDNLVGSLIVSLSGLVFGAIILIPRHKNIIVSLDKASIIFLVLAGICALAIDYFTLKTYSSGLPASIGGTLIIGGSIALTVILGLLLGEEVSAIKIIGILLVMGGASLLFI